MAPVLHWEASWDKSVLRAYDNFYAPTSCLLKKNLKIKKNTSRLNSPPCLHSVPRLVICLRDLWAEGQEDISHKGSVLHVPAFYNRPREVHTHSSLTNGKTEELSIWVIEIQGPDQSRNQSPALPMTLLRGPILPGFIQGPTLCVMGPFACAGLETLCWAPLWGLSP